MRDLYERGLTGMNSKLVGTDGCPCLHKALETVYPYIPKQRCWVHKLWNVSNNVRRRDQKACTEGARLIYLAKKRREASRKYKEWEEKWYPSILGR